MTPEERRMLGEMVNELLTTGKTDAFVAELADSGMAGEVWCDDEAVALVFAAHGAAAESSVLLDHAALRPAGALPGRLVLPALGTSSAPGRWDGTTLAVDGLVLTASDVTRLAVGTDAGDIVVVDALGLQATPAPGFDPDLGMLRVEGVVCAHGAQAVPGLAWTTVAVRVARTLAFELLGVARAALDRGVAHVMERHQFGRPLAAFQAVRHRLADVAIALTGAEELTLAAGPDLDLDEAVLVVKATAGRAALLAVREAQQVCGGMGFTKEFGLHRLVRRAYMLDSLLGGCETCELDLGAAALASGHIPEPVVAL
jgi:hypothetical protein